MSGVVVCCFAWVNSMWRNVISKIHSRRLVVMAGGLDIVSLPELGYGNLLNSGAARRTKFALRRAELVVAVSESIRNDAQKVSGRGDIRLIHHGFDETKDPFGRAP